MLNSWEIILILGVVLVLFAFKVGILRPSDSGELRGRWYFMGGTVAAIAAGVFLGWLATHLLRQ